ncbi:ABC transporter permease subunit [Aggregatibacter actinomycetemcomitans]|uniref:ABC transporter permease subunit n=1 Tax=Aggregatibacter actinomycetemcomitans TaxID=714 RepID=UPI00197B967F|nr:ABC transporter permease subunit [Aggregatibacter actinomycetemcomitans]MBN6079313.1 ABC transporter permease subunit [Aggregatibacter actinomycetemcomitans]
MQDREPEDFRETATLKHIWQLFRKDRIALFGFYAFLLLILTALFGPLLAPYPSEMQFVGKELTPPSWASDGQIAYFFGTDDIGRDVFSRILIGTSYTVGAAVIVAIITALIGGGLGILAGMSQGIKSRVLGHFLDAFLTIPVLLVAIIIATLMEPNLINAMLSVGLALLPYFVHEIYLSIQQELKKEYVLMLRLDGISKRLLLKDTILPNIATRYIQEISRAFNIAILDISALSFIALGAQRPAPEWGAMIQDSLELIYLAPWTVILPGLAIILSVLISLIFTNGLCKAIDKYYE